VQLLHEKARRVAKHSDLNLTLDRDQQILNRLSKIEHKVDSLEQTTAFALRAEKEKHSASVKEIFKTGKRRVQIYLAVDGIRSVKEIAAHLKMKQPNVSRELKILAEEGLLKIVDTSGGRDTWAKNPIDRTLRITQFLRTEYALDSDGRSAGGTRKRR
jgi:DNA-binding transcriptional ArsR family regulator